jgi:hypothetical protein
MAAITVSMELFGYFFPSTMKCEESEYFIEIIFDAPFFF